MEFTKIRTNKKAIIAIVFLLLAEIIIFTYIAKENSKNREDKYYRQWAREQYVSNYVKDIKKIIAHADSIGSISIFAQKDSFSSKNIQKTAKDYKKLLDVQPVAFESDFIEEFLSYKFSNIAVAIAGIIIVLILTMENSEGMSSIVYSTVNGRGRLQVKKIFTILVCDIFLTMIFYLAIYVVSALYYKADLFKCMEYPIQSVMMFSECSYKINIFQFLIIFLLMKSLALFAVSVCVWAVMSFCSNLVMSIGIIGVIGIVQFILYKKIGYQHPMVILKYCNFFYLLGDTDFFVKYRNFGFKTFIVNKNTVSLIYLVFVSCIVSVAAVVVSNIVHPFRSGSNFLKGKLMQITGKIQAVFNKITSNLSVGLMEVYKLMVRQKGVLIVILFCVITYTIADYTGVSKSGAQKMYYEFMDRYKGRPSAESENEIKKLSEEIQDLNAFMDEMSEKYAKGEIDSDTFLNYSNMYRSREQDRMFLKEITAQTEYISKKNQDGYDAWYVNQYNFNHLLKSDKPLTEVIMILAIVLLCSGIFSYEKEAGIIDLIKSTEHGRKKIFYRKIILSVIVAAVIAAVTIIIEWNCNAIVYGIDTLNAPAVSLIQLDNINPTMSIGTFFVIIYVIRIFIAISMGLFISFVSIFLSRKYITEISMIFCIPTILAGSGIEWFNKISITNVMSFLPYVTDAGNLKTAIGIVVFFAMFMGLSVFFGYRKWNRV